MGRSGYRRMWRNSGGLIRRHQGQREKERPEKVRDLWPVQIGPLPKLSRRNHHMDRFVPHLLRSFLRRMAMDYSSYRICRYHLCNVQRRAKAGAPSDADIWQRSRISGIYPHHPAPAAVHSDILPRKTQMASGIGILPLQPDQKGHIDHVVVVCAAVVVAFMVVIGLTDILWT